MSYVNPDHPKTQSAINLALDLAADFLPRTDPQLAAQTAIYRACKSGQLGDVADALNKARRYGTPTWREWQRRWLHAVELQIVQDLKTRRAAA